MGRADIAILSVISFGIRLCLHPRALCGGSAYDGLRLAQAFRGRTIRCPTASERSGSYGGLSRSGHLITRFCALSRYGVIRIVVSTCDGFSRLWLSPARSKQDGSAFVAPV